ncbi:MAG: phosphatase PAP2 family protein [Bacteroidales bacterium]|nr:phosphatase PAP2 family protein [Bacteroidales bacterium]
MGKIERPLIHYGVRALVLLFIFVMAWQENKTASRRVAGLRRLFPLLMLGYWYQETFYFNNFLFDNLDRYFIAADETLFGGQPSLAFSRYLPQAWFSELMYFGYFSYYFLVLGVSFWCYVHRNEITDKFIFLIVGSFYCYYLIFIVFPVVGPQYQFLPPANEVPDGYLFSRLMHFLQATGEKPTGAFPSSHVGITLIVVIFIYRHCRSLFRYALPLFIILVFSTVYIKAHYLIDVVGGFVTGFLFYWLFSAFVRFPKRND